MSEFDRKYQALVRKIYTQGIEERNQRTGSIVKALPGETLEVNPEDGFPFLTLRRLRPETFIAEQVWFLMGSRRPEELLQDFTNIWDSFMNITGVVTTAYGFRWKHHFGRDQIAGLVNLLEEEPSSRHGVVVTWDPASDGLSRVLRRANVPCPYTFTANIMGDKLHLHNVVRSNDMYLGAPPDIAGFALLQRILAARLGVGIGKYTHSISNAHLYENQFTAVETLLERNPDHPPIQLEAQADFYDRARMGDRDLVRQIAKTIREQYHPHPAIGRVGVVL